MKFLLPRGPFGAVALGSLAWLLYAVFHDHGALASIATLALPFLSHVFWIAYDLWAFGSLTNVGIAAAVGLCLKVFAIVIFLRSGLS